MAEIRKPAIYVLLLAAVAVLLAQRFYKPAALGGDSSMTQLVHAPQLDSDFGWLNTDRPLRIGEELKGQIVLLDFWTYCCINCMHILPDLEYLEEKYKNDPLTVIGVHSAKFANERDLENIRSAVLRYQIKHPVVVDSTMSIWRSYGVRSWPSFVLIDPQGYIYGKASGEGIRADLDRAIGELLELHREKGTLAAAPLKLRREQAADAKSGLAFPGKVLADAAGGRLFVSDSNHNRVVVATLPDETGRCKLIKVIGSGLLGRKDGAANHASFDHPQGVALAGNKLFVADTENHLIRQVDLETFEVTTFAGTGAMSYDRSGGAKGTDQGINSPWDVVYHQGQLYVAMAGLHQLWRFDLATGTGRAFAGSGTESITDGPARQAALSQPSGVCISDGNLFFADSEVSAVRGVELETLRVFTVVGTGLFDFGDVDGKYPQARLQHALGVTPFGDELLVADTYNHKIKLVDPQQRTSTTWIGTGERGRSTPPGLLQLYEPGGLHEADGALYVADTNNHRILRIDTGTKKWCEVVIEGLAEHDHKKN